MVSVYYFAGLLLLGISYCWSIDIDYKPHNETHMHQMWILFKNNYNKTYSGILEARRKEAWLENCQSVHEHNQRAVAGQHSYMLRLNPLSDLSDQNYQREMVKLTPSHRRNLADNDAQLAPIPGKYLGVPSEVDWRKEGFVTPPLNQRDCGSCYAFSVAHILQAQVYKVTKNLVPLSEQQIVDCSTSKGNYGCSGGSLRNTLRYLEDVGGIVTAVQYPYIAKQTKCKYDKNHAVVNITRWAILPARDEDELQKTVANVGPVAVSINASPKTFQLYHKGIYDDISCSSNAVNHAMLIVGYTKDAWILKNWWGEHWGENGYMRLRRKKNACGVANYVAYATVD